MIKNMRTAAIDIREQTLDFLIECHNEQFDPYPEINSVRYLQMLLDDEPHVEPNPAIIVVEVEFSEGTFGQPFEMISMLVEEPWIGKTTILRKTQNNTTGAITIGVQFYTTDDYFNFTMTPWNTLIRNVHETNTSR